MADQDCYCTPDALPEHQPHPMGARGCSWAEDGAVTATTPAPAMPLAVTVSLVITVDLDAWRLAYGQDVTRARIREEVRAIARDACGPEGAAFAADAGVIDVRYSR